MKKPKNWRKGKYIFNLLEFMREKGIDTNQNHRLADSFHLSDKEFDKLQDEFDILHGSV